MYIKRAFWIVLIGFLLSTFYAVVSFNPFSVEATQQQRVERVQSPSIVDSALVMLPEQWERIGVAWKAVAYRESLNHVACLYGRYTDLHQITLDSLLFANRMPDCPRGVIPNFRGAMVLLRPDETPPIVHEAGGLEFASLLLACPLLRKQVTQDSQVRMLLFVIGFNDDESVKSFGCVAQDPEFKP